jgi:hypothetical protein
MLDPTLRKNLVHEDRWSRVYRPEPNFYAYESKFEDGLSVTVDEISVLWDTWDESQRLGFAKAFAHKVQLDKVDEALYAFLVAKGDEKVWSEIALSLTKHSDKRLVLDFLLDRLVTGSEPKGNYIQALYVLGDKAALPRLRDLHSQLSSEIKRAPGEPDYWIIYDYLKCCEALAYLEGVEQYRNDIRPFLNHHNQAVRIQAEMAFAGPHPEEFE